MTTINYVIAAYMGDRWCGELQNYAGIYLREHLDSLIRLEHSLAQVTIVISGDADGAILRSLPTRVGTADVVVRQRPNVGLSYGAFSDALSWYGEAFSHYLFTEDDYLFTQHGFDAILLAEIDKAFTDKCGMMSGAAYRVGHIPIGEPHYKHAAVSIALCPTKALMATAQLSGKLPYGPGAAMADGYFGQTAQSYTMERAGWDVEDWLMRFASAYWDSANRSIRWFSRAAIEECVACGRFIAKETSEACPHMRGGDGPPGGDFARDSLIVPIQAAYCDAVQVSNGSIWQHFALDRNGRLT